MLVIQSLLGLAVFTAIPYFLSENRNLANLKRLMAGICLQAILAITFLKLPFLRQIFASLNDLVLILERAATDGGSFMFGYLGGGTLPFAEMVSGKSYIIAFRVMPIVLVMSAVSAVLFHWGVIQFLVRIFSSLLQKTLKISGIQGLSVSSSVFLGIVETPLFMRPYVNKMSRSTLFTMMTAAMATVAGTVMVLYAGILKTAVPDAMSHILVASIISAPAAVVIAHLWIPETARPEEEDRYLPVPESSSTMDALIRGTNDGMQLAIGIVGMIIVLFSFISLANQLLAFFPTGSDQPLTIEYLASLPFRPIVWLMGIPWSEAPVAARLMGIKTVLNEFVSYQRLAETPVEALCEKSRIILTYAMCGFANLASLALLTGSLTLMAPERRHEISVLGLRSILAGTLATCMTGAIISLII